MREDVKARWIEALRSGSYIQGQGALCQREGDQKVYCCLGVLCELHRQEAGGSWDYGSEEDVYNYHGCEGFLPDVVSEWSGLLAVLENHLSYWNDHDATFQEIADYLETKLRAAGT